MFGCCCSSNGRKTTILAALVTAGATIVGARLLTSSDAEPQTEPATPAVNEILPAGYQPEMEEMTPEQMMALMTEWGAPVEQHKLLESMAGSWDCTTKFWMAPGAPPTETAATCEAGMILGGRYVTEHVSIPDFMGMDFEGYGATGFDKAKGKFVTTWLDNMSTGFMTMEGEFDEDTHTMTWTGNAVYPGPEGVMEVPVKHIVKFIGDDERVMEFWEPNPENGELMRTGEISYTRRK